MNLDIIIEDFLNTPIEQISYKQTRPIIKQMFEEYKQTKPNELVGFTEEPMQRAFYEKWKDVAYKLRDLEKLRTSSDMDTRIAISDATKAMNWFPWGYKYCIQEA